MIIEAQDGLYYTDPVLYSLQAALAGIDDELVLILREKCSQRQACKELGISIFKSSIKEEGSYVWPTGIYVPVTFLSVILKEPIPVPEMHRGVSDHRMNGNPLICWSMKFPEAMISNIKAGARDKGAGYLSVKSFLDATDKTFNRKLNSQDLTPVNGYITLRRKHAYIR